MLRLDPIPIAFEDLPTVSQQGASPDAPVEKRMLLAKALLPMPPEDLLTTLIYLADDARNADVATAARESIEKLPWGVVASALGQHPHPGVLDWLPRYHTRKEDLYSLIVSNRATADTTVAFIANRGKGPVLEQIAANQMRMQRWPEIVEALYYNPDARMGTVSTMLENAVRMGIDLSHIPGYREIVESIFGKEAAAKIAGGMAEPEPPAPEPIPDVEVPPPEEIQVSAEAGAEVDWGALLEQEGEGLDEAAFAEVLAAAAQQAEEAKAEEALENEKEKVEEKGGGIWNQVAKMSVPQKVRLALLGSDQVRSMLIRDNRRIVFLSVLKSPRITDKEIATYAKNKALNAEVVMTIAQNREWTKLYSVKMSLVHNPKCPPVIALGFVRSLSAKDCKHLSQSKDVPGYIARQAKNLLQTREAKR